MRISNSDSVIVKRMACKFSSSSSEQLFCDVEHDFVAIIALNLPFLGDFLVLVHIRIDFCGWPWAAVFAFASQ